jgi:hypothetical protein
MWKNLVESNIMVGTHSDSMVAQAMLAGGSILFPSPPDSWETLSSMFSLPPCHTSAGAEYTST